VALVIAAAMSCVTNLMIPVLSQIAVAGHSATIFAVSSTASPLKRVVKAAPRSMKDFTATSATKMQKADIGQELNTAAMR